MNAAVQILIAEPGDNLPISGNASRLLRAYSSNETIETSLHVSNYGAGGIPAGSALRWKVVAGPENRTVCGRNFKTSSAIPQGPGTTAVAEVSCRLPDLGTTAGDLL